MPGAGAHFRFGAVFRALDFVSSAAMATALVREILCLRRMLEDFLRLAAIDLFAPDTRLIFAQKIADDVSIVTIGGRRRRRLDQFLSAVGAEMRVRAEIATFVNPQNYSECPEFAPF